MSLESLQLRLSALQESTAQLRKLIDQLDDINKLGSPADTHFVDVSDAETSSEEISADIKKLLRDGEDNTEALAGELEFYQPEGPHKDELQEATDAVGKDLRKFRTRFRKVRLAVTKTIAQAHRREHELELDRASQAADGPSSPPIDGDASPPAAPSHPVHSPQLQRQQLSRLSDEERHNVSASTNVTNALRQTHALIQSELERSAFARETLEESSAALKQLSESYGSLDEMLTSTRKLLGTLVTSQKTDTWYLQTTFYMLVATAAWLLFRRLLYGPLWWFLWLPLRLMFGIGSKAVSNINSGTNRQKGESMGSGQPKLPVQGIPGDELPTAQVGKDTARTHTDEAGAVQDDVDKLVHAANRAEELGSLPDDTTHEQIPVREERVKDEL